MRIEEQGDLVVIEDSPASLVLGRVVGIVVVLAFLFHAIEEWAAYVSGPLRDLKSVLLASVGVVLAAVVCAFVLTSRSIIVVDRARRMLSVEKRGLMGTKIEDVRFDEIAQVTIKVASGGEDYEIDVITHSGGAVRLTSTVGSYDKAKEIAATIDAARRS